MEQSPSWEANQFSASQEIPDISWNPKVHYCIHTCPPPVPIVLFMDPWISLEKSWYSILKEAMNVSLLVGKIEPNIVWDL
jgi:hypothetical protein